jgi:hypothetical protein
LRPGRRRCAVLRALGDRLELLEFLLGLGAVGDRGRELSLQLLLPEAEQVVAALHRRLAKVG